MRCRTLPRAPDVVVRISCAVADTVAGIKLILCSQFCTSGLCMPELEPTGIGSSSESMVTLSKLNDNNDKRCCNKAAVADPGQCEQLMHLRSVLVNC